jgi:hypothetical protein
LSRVTELTHRKRWGTQASFPDAGGNVPGTLTIRYTLTPK